MSDSVSPSAARNAVVAAALELFVRHGFESTSVEQIAQAAGVSRSTFFRQFRRKEDVVFSDHELILAELRAFFGDAHDDPWEAVCEASEHAFRHFAADPTMAQRRYEVVRGVPVLREREIVAVFGYEKLFDDYLRRALPGVDPLDAVGFAALVTAVHNHILRRLLRGDDVSPETLRAALDRVKSRFGVGGEAAPADDDLVVAVFPRGMPAAEVARRVQAQLPV